MTEKLESETVNSVRCRPIGQFITWRVEKEWSRDPAEFPGKAEKNLEQNFFSFGIPFDNTDIEQNKAQ